MKDLKNYSLKEHNTFGIDAKCGRFLEYETAEEAQKVAAILREVPTPYIIIGGGSNLLLTKDFEGIVVHSAIKGVAFDGNKMRCGSGETWDDVVEKSLANGLFGLENLSLIPGEVGAAAVQNIGAYGAEAKDIIESVETLDTETLRERVFSREECGYGYRSSFFKTEQGRRFFILSVVFRLSLKPGYNLSYGTLKDIPQESLSLEAVREKVIATRDAKLPAPEKTGSAGSFFMNPVVPRSKYEELAAEYPDMPHYPAAGDMVKLSAGWMIDRCGLKGYRLGRAGVYDKQALVLVNNGGATAGEVLSLAAEVIKKVKEKFGVELHPEVQIIKNG